MLNAEARDVFTEIQDRKANWLTFTASRIFLSAFVWAVSLAFLAIVAWKEKQKSRN